MWSDVISQNSWAAASSLFLIDLLVKITIILAAGCSIAWLMRRRSAASKHLVWTFSLISCLFVPAAMLVLPGWGTERALPHISTSTPPTPVVPASSATTEVAAAHPPTAAAGEDAVDQRATQVSNTAAPTVWAGTGPVPISREYTSANAAMFWLCAAWMAGFLIVLLPLIIGIARIGFLRRQSEIIRGEHWNHVAAEVAHSLRYRRGLRLYRTAALDVPLCGGIVRPWVMLPRDSEGWTPERGRLVLLHELAHASRHDVPVQWLCRLVCAAYWFHPLVWLAARRMKAEQERACDDLVLTAGVATARDYAEHLVAIAANCRTSHRHPVAAVAFVRPGDLESRIRCILDPDRPRVPLSGPIPSVLLLVLMGCMVSVATAGRVIVRNREGAVVVTVAVPEGGTVTIEEQSVEDQTSADNLDELIDTVIESSSERVLDAEMHTPYQIMRLFVPYGREHVVRLDGSFVNTLEFVSGGPAYRDQPWFEKTSHGGRAHPFTVPYAFEGQPNQFAAWLSTADLPLEHEFQTADGAVSIADMLEHAQATVGDVTPRIRNKTSKSEWTLWFLTSYLKQDAEWINRHGDAWNMEELVRIQVDSPVRGTPLGGLPQLYALTLARNARREQTGQLDGVWLEADHKIDRLIDLARRHQHSDGSCSGYVLYESRNEDDWQDRVGATGTVLAWLSIALPTEELDAEWIRDAVRFVATELDQNRRAPMDVDDLADGLHGLVAYRRHGGVDEPGGE